MFPQFLPSDRTGQDSEQERVPETEDRRPVWIGRSEWIPLMWEIWTDIWVIPGSQTSPVYPWFLELAHFRSMFSLFCFHLSILPLWDLAGQMQMFLILILYALGWVPKNWCFPTVVLEKTLESPLDYKEIKPVNLKGNQPWIFIGRLDAEAEALILWPPVVKCRLIGKDPDAGKDWRQEEQGATEDEMVGWHHQLNRHEVG